MAPVLHLLVRWAHVLGMALLFGGSLLTWALFRDGRPIRAAATYEWLFWAGAGVLVATGVGNLGALAPAVPGPGTAWGRPLALKLLAVLGLLVGSVPRTLAVVRWLGDPPARPPAAARRLRACYGATTAYLLLVVALAEVLAHG